MSKKRIAQGSGVKYQKGEYKKYLPIWEMIDDVCAGERAVKEKADKYLPMPNPEDLSKENKDRFRQYIKRAYFFNATGRTLDGLLGLVFREDPSIDLEPNLLFLEKNCDGKATPLIQQARLAVSENIKKGRLGLFVDYPSVEKDKNLTLEAKPIITLYTTENIINWRVEIVEGKKKLTLVVLQEHYEPPPQSDDYFSENSFLQYRVLRLVEGKYIVEIWREGSESEFTSVVLNPKNAKGKSFTEIPFVFIGSVNNDEVVDPPPLYDLAELNLAHYRNSADYEDSCFFSGQPQPWISGLTEEWVKLIEKRGIYIGSRSPLVLPEGGAFDFAQADPNVMAGEAMEKKEKQMQSLGARLLMDSSRVRTATEAQADVENESSVLSSISLNVSDGYTKAFTWLKEYIDGEKPSKTNEEVNVFALLRQFFRHSVDSDVINALVQAWQSGILPAPDIWQYFRENGIIDPGKGDSEIKDDLDSEDYSGLLMTATLAGQGGVEGDKVKPGAKGAKPTEQ